jgi:hypothetical protein
MEALGGSKPQWPLRLAARRQPAWSVLLHGSAADKSGTAVKSATSNRALVNPIRPWSAAGVAASSRGRPVIAGERGCVSASSVLLVPSTELAFEHLRMTASPHGLLARRDAQPASQPSRLTAI